MKHLSPENNAEALLKRMPSFLQRDVFLKRQTYVWVQGSFLSHYSANLVQSSIAKKVQPHSNISVQNFMCNALMVKNSSLPFVLIGSIL